MPRSGPGLVIVKSVYWAAMLAPVVGPAMRWMFYSPGRWLARWVWKKMPYGRLRSFLLTDLTFPAPASTSRPPRSPEAQRTRRPTPRPE